MSLALRDDRLATAIENAAGLPGTPPLWIAADANRAELARRSRLIARPGAAPVATPRLDARWASSFAEVRACQRLRHEVFVGEMGARLRPPAGAPAGHDVDLWDPHCEHLMVRALDTESPAAEPQVVGTYRVLTPEAARQAGGFYTETEFDLTRLRALRPQLAEIGRSCVHPAHRQGGVILSLWAELARFMVANGLEYVIGCASVPMRDGGHAAASLWRQLAQDHLAPIEWRVTPRLALPVEELRSDLVVEPPPLVKGYLRCGARLLGAPAWDPDFGTADLPLLIRLADMPARYRRHLLGEAAEGGAA
jgi:putative hemolysin